MAGEPHGKGHPTLQTNPQMLLDNCQGSWLEGPLACSSVARGEAMGGPASLVAGGRLQIVRHSLVLIEVAEVMAWEKTFQV